MADPKAEFWQERFDKNETGWDRGGSLWQSELWDG